MTTGLAYLAAIGLAAVFAYSAIAKFRDAYPTRRALQKARVPGAGLVARIVPVVEVAVAIGLLVRPSSAAVVALGVLAVFTGFITYLIAAGIDVSCGCFGANATDSVSSADLVRNGFLLLLAAVALGVESPSGIALEEVIFATTAAALAAVVVTAVATRNKLGQLFDNRLPGER